MIDPHRVASSSRPARSASAVGVPARPPLWWTVLSVFAAVLLGQIPSTGQVLGGVLVLAGIVVVQGGSAAAPPWAVGRVLLGRLRRTMRG